MRRVLFVIAGVVLLAVTVGWGYLTYRQYRSYQTLIPRTTTSIIRIQVDALAKDIAWNALWNGDYYGDSTEDQPIAFDSKIGKQSGIAIPANIFLYQIDHPQSASFPDVFFGSLQLADSAAFAGWLASRLGMQVRQDTMGTVALSERAVFLLKARQVLFAISPARPAKDLHLLTGLLDPLLQPGASIPVGKSRFSEIQHRGGHLCMLGKHDATVDFKKGEILFYVRQAMDTPLAAETGTPHFTDSNAVSLWFQGPLTSLLSGRKFHIGTHTLHGDSLLSHYQGHILMEWRGTIIQQDTVIEYDYDENFDAVERREIVEKRVPEVYLSVRADSALNRYLQEQGILNATGNAINRDVFPLFQVGVNPRIGDYIQFHTADHAEMPPEPGQRAHGRFQLHINFSKMDVQDIAPLAVPIVRPFDRIEAYGQPSDDNEQLINGKLLMKNQRINSLVQLLMPPLGEEQPPAL